MLQTAAADADQLIIPCSFATFEFSASNYLEQLLACSVVEAAAKSFHFCLNPEKQDYSELVFALVQFSSVQQLQLHDLLG